MPIAELKMKQSKRNTLIGIVLVLSGAIWICIFSYKNHEIIKYLSVASLGIGWYFICYNLLRDYLLRFYRRYKIKYLKRKGISRLLYFSFLTLSFGSTLLCFALSDKIVDYVLDNYPSKITTAKITSVEDGPNFKQRSYDVTFMYINKSDTITQGFATQKNSIYWAGRPLLIRYSLKFPDMYVILKRL
jgi:hypothetical protein